MELDRYIRRLASLRDLDHDIAMPIAIARFAQRLGESRGARGEDECWVWSRGRTKKGYGWMVGAYAHRASWEVANNSEIPRGAYVMHICDNPPCVNPAHLRIGDNLDNIADKVAKGRQTRGEAHYISKLNPLKVRATRTLYASGQFTQKEIADLFGVTREAIRQVLQGRSWSHVDQERENPV